MVNQIDVLLPETPIAGGLLSAGNRLLQRAFYVPPLSCVGGEGRGEGLFRANPPSPWPSPEGRGNHASFHAMANDQLPRTAAWALAARAGGTGVGTRRI